MEVIIIGPDEKNSNPFFKEIITFSKTNYSYCDWNSIESGFKGAILFQWPELIFHWEEPNTIQLDAFELKVKSLKGKNKIVYLVHNERRHFGMTPAYQRLYNIVEDCADIMVHLGEYSKSIFSQKFPDKTHVVIAHPLYANFFKPISKNEARLKLNISQDRKVLVVPGRIRNLEERKFILNAFKNFQFKDKTLIVPYMLKKEVEMEFRGRHLLKKIFDIKKYQEDKVNNFNPPQYYINYNFTLPEKLSLYMSAADAILIPRLNILNSGNLYLALTFRKPVLGPDVGNLSEYLDFFNLPKFDPSSLNPSNSMKKLNDYISQGKKLDEEKLKSFNPEIIGGKWDDLFNQLNS